MIRGSGTAIPGKASSGAAMVRTASVAMSRGLRPVVQRDDAGEDHPHRLRREDQSPGRSAAQGAFRDEGAEDERAPIA